MRLIVSITLLFVLMPNTAAAQSRVVRRADSNKAAKVAASVGAQMLPLRRVILYSNGVAYFERRGIVLNRAEVSLSFKQSQVDDVLKSMVVLDLGRGRIGAVSYNSSAPPSARLSDIPFSIEAGTNNDATEGGLAGVLRQLQGARVVVMTANRTATGQILTVEERRSQLDANKPSQVTHSLVLASDSGELASFNLADVRAVRLVDEDARRDITEFASASASARRRDAKTIVVTSDGAGSREMIVSYTVAAPVWKTTYRVVLDAAGKPFFQGWAIVDNVGEEDWSNVQLALVSGSPVSFIQPIQQPFYRYRPVVPIPESLNLDPQVYEPGQSGMNSGGGGSGGGGGGRADYIRGFGAGSMIGTVRDQNGAVVPGATVTATNSGTRVAQTAATSDDGRFTFTQLPPGIYTISVERAGFKRHVRSGVVLSAGGGLNAGEFILEAGSVTETVEVTSRSSAELITDSSSVSAMSAPETSLSDAMTSENSGVKTAATGAEIGDLFEYRIDQPVTVRRDRSALIPILQTRMEGERVSIYNEAARKDRPMSGIRLRNTSALTLEGGSLTVIDADAYAGEALMERLKPGEDRFISFALDLSTLVAARSTGDREPVFLVRTLNGVFQAHYYQTENKVYTFTNQTDRPRAVFVEHPRRDGWVLSEKTPQAIETTAGMYRFRVDLAPRASVELPVTERRALMDTYAISNITPRDLELFVARRYVDDTTRAALEQILNLKGRIANLEARVAVADREAEQIAEDQTRLRENIKALGATAEARQLIARYVAKANEQETRLEQLTSERRTATNEQTRLRAELDEAVRVLAIDRKL